MRYIYYYSSVSFILQWPGITTRDCTVMLSIAKVDYSATELGIVIN